MTTRLTILGTSGTFATAQRAASGYLLEIDGRRLWLDAGAGTWRNLLRFCSYENLDGVVLSHRHPDHTTDVFQIVHARRYGGPEPLPPIPLWAPAETLEKITAYTGEVDETFDLNEVSAGDAVVAAGIEVTFHEMAHPPTTLGCRVCFDGGSLAYSADTGGGGDVHAVAADVDVFICEATFQNSDELWEGHLRASQAAAIAREAGAKELVLTHLPPDRDHDLSLVEAQQESGDVAVRLASDNLRIGVGS